MLQRLTNFNLPLRAAWDDAESSFWFRPSLLAFLAIVLAAVAITIDQFVEFPLWLTTTPDNARTLLSTIASSVFTAATVTFSIIMLALVVASQQFSPRILRQFMRDHASQNVLGVFIGTFIYCLLVMGRIGVHGSTVFVPTLSVLGSLILSLVSIAAFIYYVDHIAKIIRINDIIVTIHQDTMALLDYYFPETTRPLPASTMQSDDMRHREEPGLIRATRTGYVQGMDPQALLALTEAHDLTLEAHYQDGDFVERGRVLVSVWPASAVSDTLAAAVMNAFDIGHERTMFQDMLFGIRQLVDIALKAISPAVNDPTTAVTALDYMGHILLEVAQRPDPVPWHLGQDGTVRLVTPVCCFEDILELAFSQIRVSAGADTAVVQHMLIVLQRVAEATHHAGRHADIWRHVQMIARQADRLIAEPQDRRRINQRLKAITAVLGETAAPILLTTPDPLNT